METFIQNMELFVLNLGYPGLFLLGFLAATIIPLGSEWLLAALILAGFNPALCVGVASAGNSLGALTTYAIGLWGGPWLIERVLRIDSGRRKKAEQTYARYGVWSLLFSWLPVIGDPLCLVGGLMRVHLLRYFLLVTVGKYARYQIVALAVLASM
jgi:membrane protein YqaA with SNARE-associated domain